MRWTILTPRGSIAWEGGNLVYGAPVSRDAAPESDAFDDWWRDYYRAVFNPARANPEAMRAEMPKKYWRNLPEAALISPLLRGASERTQAMLDAEPAPPKKRPWRVTVAEPAPDPVPLERLRAQASGCERCPLHVGATRTVFGEGPADAPVVLVGEQPGDEEDLAGRPFVGPAGRLLDQALEAAGIDRARLYLTNAVKHFKFMVRGKRRIHQTPGRYEIEHCRWWLEQELSSIEPKLTVALGATAARALIGRDVAVLRQRGQMVRPHVGPPSLITVHPSYLLRLPDQDARAREYDRFVADLSRLTSYVPAVRAGSSAAPG
ncbi:MAG: UdgX family uracil-DNA binding protein, partial [Geminicoccaceae bacterium]|nr:UdgX family uracil-DNA binding protein [Geminicoccaceae bacterium]